jgi:hypothetical protein
MKKTLTLALEETDLFDLIRIMADEDAPAALDFLKEHLARKARAALDSG